MRLLSYEAAMLKQLAMPPRQEVGQTLLKSLVKHDGVIKEFGSHEAIVEELAAECNVNEAQRGAFLETIYRKEGRKKRSNLWHRLLFRAADSLAKEHFITRPTQTIKLTGRKEWMLTERGLDQALSLLNIPGSRKECLATKSFEVEKVVTKLFSSTAPRNYNPVNANKRMIMINKESVLRLRGFRQAVIQAYDNRCAVCGLSIRSPDSTAWEVQAAHIVPNGFMGRDDIWNGIALCHLHHWSFDVGWFTLRRDYSLELSAGVESLRNHGAKTGTYDIFRSLSGDSARISLPFRRSLYPHPTAIDWHRRNVFYHA